MPYPAGHRDKVKKKIVQSARRLFNRHGFDGVSLQQIMAGAGRIKMGLPFGYSNCSRGGGGHAPKCYSWLTNLNPPAAAQRPGLAAGFGAYLPVVADAVQSGAVRVLATDDNTDFYSVPLAQQTLRPGTVYADPYGHVLMLVRRVPKSPAARPASSSPSTASPTARSRASVFGAAASCSPTCGSKGPPDHNHLALFKMHDPRAIGRKRKQDLGDSPLCQSDIYSDAGT